MYADMHTHTNFSNDSDATLEEQLDRAVKLGMKYYCVTDHQDYDHPEGDFSYILRKREDIVFETYFERLYEAREAYKDKINLLIGIEFGLQPHLVEKIQKDYATYPFDFVIGSTHSIKGYDTEDKRLYEGVSPEQIIREYFEIEYENLKNTRTVDAFGHIDFILRDVPGKNKGFTYSKYGDILDEILKLAIDRGQAIELNTKPLVVGMRDSSPGFETFKRYRELGGELVTLGSDAHFPERIGACFDIAGDLLKEAGFKYYNVFIQHEPKFFPL
ncbi:MAG: histidinol-phosphatase HisJ family protein [Filifactor alocis]|nr:histidinol-phosphatase HisJ family protein [Filifactor alocis]